MVCDGKIETCLKCPYKECIGGENISVEEITAADRYTPKKARKTTLTKKEWQRKYYQEHKEEIKAKQKAYKEKNKERIKEYRHKHYMEHRIENLARQREYDRRKRERI